MDIFSKCSFNRPTTIKSSPYTTLTYPEFLGPSRNVQYLSIIPKKDIISAITLLGVPIRPSAISGFITFIIVNAIKRCVIWPFSHVFQKSKERFLPSFRDCNPSPSVIFISGIFWIIASSFDRTPSSVFWSILKFKCGLSWAFCMKTTTRLCVATLQITKNIYSGVATLTSAFNQCVCSIFVRFSNNSQSSKDFTNVIGKYSAHLIII